MTSDAPEPIERILRLEPSGEDRFGATLEGFEGNTFGGDILGCATRAAALSAGGRPLNSLHAQFLRPVPADTPILFEVERVKDGRRLAHRRVRIQQRDRLLFELVASFVAPSDGPGYQDSAPAPDTPAPEELPTDEEVARAEGWPQWGPSGLEWRWVGTPWAPRKADERSGYVAWVRPRHPLGEDPDLQSAALAYLSDFHSHWSVVRMLGLGFEPHGFISLDTALWQHRDLPWDDWRLLTTRSDVAHAGRALTRRNLYSREGLLVASMAQEALIPARPAG